MCVEWFSSTTLMWDPGIKLRLSGLPGISLAFELPWIWCRRMQNVDWKQYSTPCLGDKLLRLLRLIFQLCNCQKKNQCLPILMCSYIFLQKFLSTIKTASHGWWDGSVGKGTSTKSEDLILIPGGRREPTPWYDLLATQWTLCLDVFPIDAHKINK